MVVWAVEQCHSYGFAYQDRVLKALHGAGYLRSEGEVVCLWHSLVNLYMWLTISSCYGSIPLTLRWSGRDGGLSTLCHNCGFICPQGVLKMFPGSGYVCSEDEVVWLWHSLVNLYIWLTISFCYGSIALTLGLLERDGGLSTLCHNCGFACQQRVLKTFPDAGYLHSEDEVVWLWDSVVNLFMWLTISSFYSSIPLTLELLGRNGGLSTLCRSWGFACQQRVLKGSAGPAYLCSDDEVVWLWHLLGNLSICLTISSCYDSILLTWRLIGRDGGLNTLCHKIGLTCQQRVLKTFPGPGYLCSEDEVVWLWHSVLNLYIWLTISSFYGLIPLTLGLLERDSGLITLCNSYEFVCQQAVLKMFPGPGYLHSEDEVWRLHSLL